ncbi:MAG: hypothetical protein L0Y54_22020, partial [Sporichthyaceae bacterium]|nr:hypothetical protein [Sporichthyaceae bacterium]
ASGLLVVVGPVVMAVSGSVRAVAGSCAPGVGPVELVTWPMAGPVESHQPRSGRDDWERRGEENAWP